MCRLQGSKGKRAVWVGLCVVRAWRWTHSEWGFHTGPQKIRTWKGLTPLAMSKRIGCSWPVGGSDWCIGSIVNATPFGIWAVWRALAGSWAFEGRRGLTGFCAFESWRA